MVNIHYSLFVFVDFIVNFSHFHVLQNRYADVNETRLKAYFRTKGI